MEQVILVNEEDNELGVMEKMEVHQKGLLHRAFSVFIFNSQGELLLQQRALNKYHSGGLWTNTCCSHPRKGETTLQAAHRRLQEEMGMTCELQHMFHFVYRAELNDGLSEHELDHVFMGISDDLPQLNPNEAMAYQYMPADVLEQNIQQHPEQYTVWLRLSFAELRKHMLNA